MTLLELINWTASSFRSSDLTYAHGTDNPDDEAFYLVNAALEIPFVEAPQNFDANISAKDINKIKTLVRMRVMDKVPVAYLVKKAWFLGLEFFVDERVLIPRSPIAEVITKRFMPWKGAQSIGRVLDLGTGSGCIAIGVASTFPSVEIDAVDISSDALDVARINIESHNFSDRITLYQSDFFSSLPPAEYDIIISNPPYVDEKEMMMLGPEFQCEPRLGLASGQYGLDAVISILKDSFKFLANDGILIVEVGNSRDALESYFPNIEFTWIELVNGGQGVFVLDKYQIRQYKEILLK